LLFYLSISPKIHFYKSGLPVSSTNKTDHHDITEILLKVALNTVAITYIILLSSPEGTVSL
jgi:hypothetical protein